MPRPQIATTSSKKESDEVRELEELVDRRLEVWKKWKKGVREATAPPPEMVVVMKAEKGEREMTPFSGYPRRPRGLFPTRDPSLERGCVLVVGGVLGGFSRQLPNAMWLGGDEVTWLAIVSLHALVPELSWQVPCWPSRIQCMG